MKVALDASCLARPSKTGVGVYTLNLVEAIARIDKENTYYLCYRFSRLKQWKNFHRVAQSNFRVKIIQDPFNFLFRRKIDVFHGPDARLPEYRGVWRVATVHDLFSLLSAEYSKETFIRKKIERYQELARSADRIITDSESTRADIIEHLDYPEERIDVIPLAVNSVYKPVAAEEARAVARRHGVEGPYLFFVGNVSARKNLVRMLEAFAGLPPETGRDLTFVMSGKVTYGGDKVLEAIDRLGLKERVKLTGYLPFEDLPAFYSGAEVFMFPTLYEGFGIPILEAMACGTPVLTSNLSSHPEVAGDAALLVDPKDGADVADGLRRLLEDAALRKSLAAKGIKRAAGFTWDRVARKTLAVYRSATGS
jgi:glycosyltransferase involved in cell wall biosynthesis